MRQRRAARERKQEEARRRSERRRARKLASRKRREEKLDRRIEEHNRWLGERREGVPGERPPWENGLGCPKCRADGGRHARAWVDGSGAGAAAAIVEIDGLRLVATRATPADAGRAEYLAILLGVEVAVAFGATAAVIHSDSMAALGQASKHRGEMGLELASLRVVWIPREQNRAADRAAAARVERQRREAAGMQKVAAAA